MTNYEKLKRRLDVPIDEMAVGMLVERIKEDVNKRFFNTFIIHGSYVETYKAMKDWLNSEVEE